MRTLSMLSNTMKSSNDTRSRFEMSAILKRTPYCSFRIFDELSFGAMASMKEVRSRYLQGVYVSERAGYGRYVVVVSRAKMNRRRANGIIPTG